MRIQELDAVGNFIRSWNTGVGGAAFSGLAGIATAPDGSVWVAEVTAKRLQHFSATGAYKVSLRLPRGTYRFRATAGSGKPTSTYAASSSTYSRKVRVR